MNTTEEKKNGNPMDALKVDALDNKAINLNDEQEFLLTLPVGQWLFCKREAPKVLSTTLAGFEIMSPFVQVMAVGPDFLGDVVPGDRVTYAESLGLPKELTVPWAKKYCWIHENKMLGRLPRNSGDKSMKKTGQIADPLAAHRAVGAFVDQKTAEARALGVDVDAMAGNKPPVG